MVGWQRTVPSSSAATKYISEVWTPDTALGQSAYAPRPSDAVALAPLLEEKTAFRETSKFKSCTCDSLWCT